MIFVGLIGNNGRTGKQPAFSRSSPQRLANVAEVEAGFAGAIQEA
jgi:hypothetical protein